MAKENDHQGIENLVAKAAKILPNRIQCHVGNPVSLSSHDIEKASFEALCEIAPKSSTGAKVTLVGGQKFPDIVIISGNTKAGVEVKSTRSGTNPWSLPGGSIMEGNRIEEVGDVWLMFTRLADIVETRHGLYQDHVKDIAVTHSPRYLIDMDISPEDSIFRKLGLDYERLRDHPSPFDLFRPYLEEKAAAKGAHLWWSKATPEFTSPPFIRFWEDIPVDIREEMMAMAFILFPEDLIAGKSREKYKRLGLWLLKTHSVLSSSLRDQFSAGGKVLVFPDNPKAPAVAAKLHLSMGLISKFCITLGRSDLAGYWDENSLTQMENYGVIDTWRAKILKNVESKEFRSLISRIIGAKSPVS